MKLQRCQHNIVNNIYDLNFSNGQHGYGVYCFIYGDNKMKEYYSKNGEKTYSFEIPDSLILDLSKKSLDYWEAKEIIYNNSEYKAFIFTHKGFGVPTSKEILITDVEIISNLT